MNGNERLIRLQRERRSALAAARKESGFTMSLRQTEWFLSYDRTPADFGLAWEAPSSFTQAEYDHAFSTTAAMGDHKDGKPYTALRGDSDRVVTVEGESLTVSRTVANVLRKEAFQRAVTAPADKVSAAITLVSRCAKRGTTAEQAAKIASLLGLQVDPEWEPTAEEAVKVSSGGGGFRRQQQVIHQQPAQAAPVAPAPAAPAKRFASIGEALRELKALLDEGLIDQARYDEESSKLWK